MTLSHLTAKSGGSSSEAGTLPHERPDAAAVRIAELLAQHQQEISEQHAKLRVSQQEVAELERSRRRVAELERSAEVTASRLQSVTDATHLHQEQVALLTDALEHERMQTASTSEQLLTAHAEIGTLRAQIERDREAREEEVVSTSSLLVAWRQWHAVTAQAWHDRLWLDDMRKLHKRARTRRARELMSHALVEWERGLRATTYARLATRILKEASLAIRRSMLVDGLYSWINALAEQAEAERVRLWMKQVRRSLPSRSLRLRRASAPPRARPILHPSPHPSPARRRLSGWPTPICAGGLSAGGR